MKRTVRIFRFSVPLWTVVLCLAMAVGALAWGIITYQHSLTGSTGTAVEVEYAADSLLCEAMTEGMTGMPTVNSCSIDPATHHVTADFGNLSPNAVVRVEYEVFVNGQDSICTINPPAEDFVTLEEIMGSCGRTWEAPSKPRLRLDFTFNENLPSSANVSFPFDVVWEAAP